ncbi:MAG: mechanosensitive ion channel family protein [Chloroflexota bacterium]
MLSPVFLFPNTWDEWQDWFTDNGPDIGLIILGLLVVRWFFHRIFARVLIGAVQRASAARREDPSLVRRRADTLLATFDWTFTIFLLLIGTALILDQFDVQVSALITGVGVVGLAIGLGAQTLIKDVINGLFILIEGQYAVGDTVSVGGATGEVIEINPRRTVLRDAEGNIHSIPNSNITVATNLTAGLNHVAITMEVPFAESERAAALAAEVSSQLVAERTGDFVTAPRIASVRAQGDTEAVLQMLAGTRPGAGWTVEAELRRRLRARFEMEGVAMRFPGGDPG